MPNVKTFPSLDLLIEQVFSKWITLQLCVFFPFNFFKLHATMFFDLYCPQWKKICALKVSSLYNLFSQMLIKTAGFFS